MRNRTLILALALASLAGCERSEPTSTGAAKPAPAAGSQPAWLLASAPESPAEIKAAKQSVAEGDQVTLRGRIGGRSEPITKGAATFVMMDAAVPSCADNPDDACSTPWDYCCEPAEVMEANSATVQLVDASGAPIEADLAALGVEPLDEVIVVGTVGPRPAPGVLVIKATALHVVGG
jgi:hypothetical protein